MSREVGMLITLSIVGILAAIVFWPNSNVWNSNIWAW